MRLLVVTLNFLCAMTSRIRAGHQLDLVTKPSSADMSVFIEHLAKASNSSWISQCPEDLIRLPCDRNCPIPEREWSRRTSGWEYRRCAVAEVARVHPDASAECLDRVFKFLECLSHPTWQCIPNECGARGEPFTCKAPLEPIATTCTWMVKNYGGFDNLR